MASHVSASTGGGERRAGRRQTQRLPYRGQESLARGVGQPAIVANAHEAVGQDVEQKATQKGLSLHGGDPGGVAVGAVLPAEGDLTLVEREQAVVGEGDAMGVAGEIGQHLIRTGEGRFAVHDPTLGGRALEQGVRVFIVVPGELRLRSMACSSTARSLPRKTSARIAHG